VSSNPISPASEVHIAGVFVQVRPGYGTSVATALAALPNTEVHGDGSAGRLVVVCECASAGETLSLIDRMRELPGVLNVALVYQHAESAAAMEEEIGHENDPPRLH
jgi:nitrate reductase NapD